MIIRKEETEISTDYNWDVSKPFFGVDSFQFEPEFKIEPIFEEFVYSDEESRWDGNYDPLADSLEQNAKELYIKADKEYFQKHSRHIDINEGTTAEGNATRSCRRQAQLWMSWKIFNLPSAQRANLPGCSDHNYGLAVDLKAVNSNLKKIMRKHGWSDKVKGEKWHFSCVRSKKYNSVQSKIIELRNGLSGRWALDSIRAFELTKRKNELSEELDSRYQVFRSEVESFNRQAKIFNDSKTGFVNQTNGFEDQRNELLANFSEIDRLTIQLEQAYVNLRNTIDEIIDKLESDLEEIRRLKSLSFVLIDDELEGLGEIPQELENRYQHAQQSFYNLTDTLNGKYNALETKLNDFHSSNGVFEKRAIELIKEYNFLMELRRGLESKKKEIERGYVNVQLIGKESMFLFSKTGSMLDKIQQEVDNV